MGNERAPRRMLLWWLPTFALAVALAALQGWRLPGLWAVTHYAIDLGDGLLRRSLFGTVMAPVWAATDFAYGAFALVALVVLASVIAVMAVAGARARWSSQRLVVLAFLLFPTGAFLFHEVGYLDQVVYALLFAGLWLWRRTNPWLAVLPVVAAVLVHELAALTVWPILAWAALTDPVSVGSHGRARTALALPGLTAVAVVALSRPTAQQLDDVIGRISADLPFPFRGDVVALFGRSLGGVWETVSPLATTTRVLPFAVAVAAVWGWIALARPGDPSMDRRAIVGALVASIVPISLAIVGWDASRWVFLLLGNFAIVMFVWMGRQNVRPTWSIVVASIVPFVLLLPLPLVYFDYLAPRAVSPAGVEQFLEDVGSPSVPSQ